ncbi:MAG: DUF1837 domain-containing protein, partial [Saprospiraceae bacterium]|nr:DUF1837 domain-containing protein [Saprospiraceae bacterium]
KRILSKYGFDDYFNSLSLLPLADKTRKGNLGEIVLSEYLSNTTQHELLVFRLRYNPNIEQSMKGDDVLMLNPNNMDEKIILGESKYRNPPGKDVVQEILDGMGSGTKSPISLTFIENVLRTQGKVSLAQAVAKMQAKINKGIIEIVNVGFLLSNHNGHNHINSHGKSSNPNLIFISANLNNPDDFISKCYEKAHT